MSRRRLTVRSAAHLTAMAALVGGIVATVVPAWSTDHAHLDLGTALLVTTRDELDVCVQVGEPLRDRQAEVLDAVGAGLERARQHPDWAAAGLGGVPEPALGCPDSGLPDKPAARSDGEPSRYRLWVYVLDAATADRLLGPAEQVARVPAEYLADGEHGAAEVSTAVLVRVGYLADPDFATDDLTVAVGLSGPKEAGVHGTK